MLLITCEHAGNRIPKEYARLFAGAKEILSSHRGWDPGALDLTRTISRHLEVPFHHVMWSRLLVESNRAPNNSRLWSRFTKDLPEEEKERILDTYYWPHRTAVETEVRKEAARGRKVIHLAIHSFTPELDGEVRNADVTLLYDSARPAEKKLCLRWEQLFHDLDPALRVRRNYPYRGRSDGLPTWLRKSYSERNYLGVEFEMNQRYVGDPAFAKAKRIIAESIRRLVED